MRSIDACCRLDLELQGEQLGMGSQGSGAHQHGSSRASRLDITGYEEPLTLPTSMRGPASDSLGSVGLVVWQSAFLLAELLLQHPPLGPWAHVRVLDLGTGTGASLRLNMSYHVIPEAHYRSEGVLVPQSRRGGHCSGAGRGRRAADRPAACDAAGEG
jgi:hypothetical protein